MLQQHYRLLRANELQELWSAKVVVEEGRVDYGKPAFKSDQASSKSRKDQSVIKMLLSSLLNVITVIGAVYCMLVSLRALSEGPLICNSQVNSTSSCEFSFNNLSNIHPESFNLQWFFRESCVAPAEVTDPTLSGTRASDGGRYSLNFSSKENRHRMIHFSVFLGLLLVGILELMCGLSQMAIGLLGCLCGVTKRRSRIV
uniref:transmembrane 4 L6 family member 20 n=1 Tax=Panthera onca TaxID=9690 RepID=UPI0029548C5D|nr:transmembrane 4 L6 family member 20 [Panthera onca]